MSNKFKLSDAEIQAYKEIVAVRDQHESLRKKLVERISDEISQGVWLCHAYNYGSHGYLDLRIFKLNPNHSEYLRSLEISEDYFGEYRVDDLCEEGLIENYWNAEYEISTNMVYILRNDEIDYLNKGLFNALRDAIETRELSITF